MKHDLILSVTRGEVACGVIEHGNGRERDDKGVRVKLLLCWLVLTLSFVTQAADPIGKGTQQQSIKLLSNRFRMDAGIEEVTFVIQRKAGSGPVILIRPDGSKIYYQRFKLPIKWMAGNTGDMIKIPNPMPGPWQIVGNILPGSEVHLASSLELKVEPIPEELFIGEKVKLTARILLDNELLQIGNVDDLMTLLLQITSLNRPEDGNFGVGRLTVGEYLDNGQNFDEKRGDGVFTGEIDFDKPLGNYELTFTASNKTFTREYRQPLLLRPRPIKAELRDDNDGREYSLKITTNARAVDFTRQMVQIELKHPNATTEQISVQKLLPIHVLPLTSATAPGRYQLSINVLGTTREERDFVFELPTIKFVVKEPRDLLDITSTDDGATQDTEATMTEMEEPPVAREESTGVIAIAIVNLVVILLGGVITWLFLRKSGRLKPASKTTTPG